MINKPVIAEFKLGAHTEKYLLVHEPRVKEYIQSM